MKKSKIFAIAIFCALCSLLLCGCNETIIDHKISVTSSNIRYGTINGDGFYKTNQEVSITAQPNDGHSFVCWVKNDEIISTELQYKFVASKSTEGKYIAIFDGDQMQAQKLSSITLSANFAENSEDLEYQFSDITVLHSNKSILADQAIYTLTDTLSETISLQYNKVFWLDNQSYFTIAITANNLASGSPKTYTTNFLVTPTEDDLDADFNYYPVQKTFLTSDSNLEISITFNFEPLQIQSENNE